MEARFDVVLVVDADTNLEPQTLRMLARRFRDPRVGAAAGNAKVGNRHNLLTRWQALEYVASQNLERRAYDLLNGILVVPGAVGAWRRELLLSLGGFPDRTLAEDADMTLEVLRAGRRIVYEEEARGWTEVPESPRSFLKQRFRWSYGTLQVLWHHRGALFDPRLGTLGWIALPDAWISKILLPLLAPLGDLYALGILIRAVWTHFEHPLEGTAPFVPVETVLLYLAFFILVETAVSAVAILLEPQEDPLLLPWIGLQHFYYRQLLYWISAKSLLTALKGVGAGWNKLDRTGGALLPREFADPSHPNLSGKPR
jgi:cellulose synthase/poly-beta-1,6-N-acetylglucosamine synthase-like glycosyltransferase